MILDFHLEVDENRVILGYNAACSGNSLPTYQDNLSPPFSRVKNSRKIEEASGPNPKTQNKKNMKKKKKNPEDFSEANYKHVRGSNASNYDLYVVCP